LLRVLVGGAYRGVGIADCVCSGEEAAARLIRPAGAWPGFCAGAIPHG
jgi:hypothetical protein